MSQPTSEPGSESGAGVWATPPVLTRTSTATGTRNARRPGALRRDVLRGLAVAAVTVLLAAPVGLLWSAVAPRVHIVFAPGADPMIQDVEGKGFFGADGSFLLVSLAAGLLTGVLAWLLARRGGPWTVAGLLVGGLVASQVALLVGVQPGLDHAIATLTHPPSTGTLDLYLGRLPKMGSHRPQLRATFDASRSVLRHVPLVDRLRFPVPGLAWPFAALVAFLVPAFTRDDPLEDPDPPVSSG